ncbi:hypothetical protein A6E01_19860 (plasmid) [Vibrio breoganii]|uniref:YkgJ family cysteine cluster protein n=2 Tax=Vibrio TaxID=662 RepID=A0AAN0XZC8_9VIBR|nr:YkgJ family cysteine cluster protein [Vibrio breoganii]ANO35471.1 hypothetical protein A6E01_19860 [Vibrio breoganii]PML13926.1 hypothetical protein BCT84_12260 [Vibrio breoganii]
MDDWKNSPLRTVALKDEIPVRDLTEQAIAGRLAQSDLSVNRKATKHAKAVFNMLRPGVILTDSTIKKMYKDLDLFLLHTGLKKLSVCVRGCAQCCTVAVDVSYLEAMYIADSTGVELRLDKTVSKTGGCPFLVDNCCSIYEYRPIACRMFHTIDHPKYCYLDESHHYFSVNSHPQVGEFQYSLSTIEAEGYIKGNFDIRQWFSTH